MCFLQSNAASVEDEDHKDGEEGDDAIKSSRSMSKKKTAVTTKMVQRWSQALHVSLISCLVI